MASIWLGWSCVTRHMCGFIRARAKTLRFACVKYTHVQRTPDLAHVYGTWSIFMYANKYCFPTKLWCECVAMNGGGCDATPRGRLSSTTGVV